MGYSSESGYNTNSYDEPFAKRRKFSKFEDGHGDYGTSESENERGRQEEFYETLVNQLKREMNELQEDAILTPEFIKKYIIYAKRS